MKIITAKEYFSIGQKKKQSKYNNQVTVVDGYLFDSKLEADYYSQLRLLEKSGEILFFRLQPHYMLNNHLKKTEKNIVR